MGHPAKKRPAKSHKAKGLRPRKALTEQKLRFVSVFTGNAAEAGRKIGITKALANEYMADPRVVDAINLRQTATIVAAGEEMGKELSRHGVSRNGIIKRLWDLANLPPGDTGENINGQVRAAGELAEVFGMKVSRHADVTREFEGRSDEELEFFAKHGHFPVDAGQSGASGDQSRGAAAGEPSKIQ
jgi:hypothetical protein